MIVISHRLSIHALSAYSIRGKCWETNGSCHFYSLYKTVFLLAIVFSMMPCRDAEHSSDQVTKRAAFVEQRSRSMWTNLPQNGSMTT